MEFSSPKIMLSTKFIFFSLFLEGKFFCLDIISSSIKKLNNFGKLSLSLFSKESNTILLQLIVILNFDISCVKISVFLISSFLSASTFSTF